MTRVVHVSNDFEPLSGGISTHLKNLLPALAECGIEALLLVPTATDEAKREIEVDPEYSRIRVIRAPYLRAGNPINSLIRLTQATKEGLEWIEKEYGRPGLIHQHDSRATRLGATQHARKQEIPIVWTNHASGFFGKSDFTARMLTHIPGIHPDGLVVVHKVLEKPFRDEWSHCPVRYIPNGVDTRHFSPEEKSEERKETVVLFPQRMIPEKGAEELADAAAILLGDPEGPAFRFLFAGSGAASNRDERTIRNVKNRLEEYEKRGHVEYLDNPPYEEMPCHYLDADIAVLPLKIETENISVFEAWAAGTPLIVTRHMATSGYLQNGVNCLMADDCDPETLAEAIRELAEDRGLRKKLSGNGLEMAGSRFTWHRAAKQTVEFYGEILAGEEV